VARARPDPIRSGGPGGLAQLSVAGPWVPGPPDADTETPDADRSPLAGYTVAVTAARRKEELGALLARRGARVVYAPAIRIVPLSDDAELVAATREVLAAPVDLVIATTGVGFRGWLEAADGWGVSCSETAVPAAPPRVRPGYPVVLVVVAPDPGPPASRRPEMR